MADIAINSAPKLSKAGAKSLKTIEVNYDLTDGKKGSLNIPGVFKGVENVEDARVLREKSALGGLFKTVRGFDQVSGEPAPGKNNEVARTLKIASNPLRTRSVNYTTDENGDVRREIDNRVLGTNLGSHSKDYDTGKKVTNRNYIVYNTNVAKTANELKGDVEERTTKTRGLRERRYDIDAKGNETLTHRSSILSSNSTTRTSATEDTTVRKRLGGLFNKTDITTVPQSNEPGTVDGKQDKFTAQRRFGLYSMTATQATAKIEGGDSTPPVAATDAVRTQKFAGLYKRTVTIEADSDIKKIEFKMLGISIKRDVSLTKAEKTTRDEQLSKSAKVEADRAAAVDGAKAANEVKSPGFIARIKQTAQELRNDVSNGFDYFRKNPGAAVTKVGDMMVSPISNAAAGVKHVAQRFKASAEPEIKQTAPTTEIKQLGPTPEASKLRRHEAFERWRDVEVPVAKDPELPRGLPRHVVLLKKDGLNASSGSKADDLSSISIDSAFGSDSVSQGAKTVLRTNSSGSSRETGSDTTPSASSPGAKGKPREGQAVIVPDYKGANSPLEPVESYLSASTNRLLAQLHKFKPAAHREPQYGQRIIDQNYQHEHRNEEKTVTFESKDAAKSPHNTSNGQIALNRGLNERPNDRTPVTVFV